MLILKKRHLTVVLTFLLSAGCTNGKFDPNKTVAFSMLAVQNIDVSEDAQCSIANEFESKDGKSIPLSKDEKLQKKLQRIVDKIQTENNLHSFRYSVSLVSMTEPNAFTPGCGRIYVTEGMIPLTEVEAHMAMILSHEMAHGEKGHSAERQRDSVAIAAATDFVNDWLGRKVGQDDWIKKLQQFGFSMALSQYSQDAEREADQEGLIYYVAAGYQPVAAPLAFQKLHDELGSTPTLLNAVSGSHPRADDRAEKLREIVRTLPNPRLGISNTKEWDQLTRAYRLRKNEQEAADRS
jgi:predicted Zn-dependent protease